MLFHRGERFAHPGSELASDLAQRIEDILSPGRLRLLLVEDITGIAGFRSQTQNVLASKARNRALENRGAPGSLADLLARFQESAAHLFGRPIRASVCWTCWSDIKFKVRRLLKLHGQPLAQRVVKYRIAGLILEIREDNGILVGQLGS